MSFTALFTGPFNRLSDISEWQSTQEFPVSACACCKGPMANHRATPMTTQTGKLCLVDSLGASNKMSSRPTITRLHRFVIPAKAGIQPRMHRVQVSSATTHSDSPRRLFAIVRILDSLFRGNDVWAERTITGRPIIVSETLNV